MTLEQYEDMLRMVDSVIELQPKWRRGQTVFNLLVQLYPEDAEVIRGSSLDMFYNDENIDEFKKTLK